MDTANPEVCDDLVLSHTFKAPVATVWSAWTDEDMMAQWWGPQGCACPGAKIDLRVGGRFELPIDTPDGQHLVAVGEYLEIVPQKRLGMTWLWLMGPDAGKPTQEVTIEFAASGTQTTVKITHAKCLDPVELENLKGGWESSLQSLAEVLSATTS